MFGNRKNHKKRNVRQTYVESKTFNKSEQEAIKKIAKDQAGLAFVMGMIR